MNLNDDHLSLYDILELTPDATPQEIRSAYLRLKSSYNKDNIAHYTLFSREETEKMLNNIENAYVVLSNPEKRRTYDHSQGQNNITSESSDFVFGSAMSTTSAFAHPSTPTPSFSSTASPLASSSVHTHVESVISDVDSIIQNEQEWGGAAIRRVREARRISLERKSL